MKAVQIAQPNQLRLIEMEKPVIDEKNNVLVRMTAAGICGSDVGIYHGANAAATYPRVIGHEMVGVVEETGPGAKKSQGGRPRHHRSGHRLRPLLRMPEGEAQRLRKSQGARRTH